LENFAISALAPRQKGDGAPVGLLQIMLDLMENFLIGEIS
jgi:hypothetical protein